MKTLTIQKAIKNDHSEIRKLLKDLEMAIKEESIEEKEEIFTALATEVMAHSKAEEKYFYDTLLGEVENEDLLKKLKEAKEEHHVVDIIIKEIKALNPDDDQWDAKCAVLKENLTHHIKEEESEIIPESTEVMDQDESTEMCEKFEMKKDEIQHDPNKA